MGSQERSILLKLRRCKTLKIVFVNFRAVHIPYWRTHLIGLSDSHELLPMSQTQLPSGAIS